MNGEFISVGKALKLVQPFKGNKQEVLAFIGNVDTAFAVINPSQEAIFYKFVLMCISHRNLNNWAELKAFLQNAYTEKRTLHFQANQLLKARQETGKKVVDWNHKIQTLRSQFREPALLNCSEGIRK
jgi:hypothetical protein